MNRKHETIEHALIAQFLQLTTGNCVDAKAEAKANVIFFNETFANGSRHLSRGY